MLIGKVAAKNLPDTPYNLITEKKMLTQKIHIGMVKIFMIL